ncbi:MAG: Myo-inositol 2-dehydrogenase [uncultured Arthrobacter sp.]|uniref:Myo-inositol 2-dehydrogenase n=1 Tax=uncultured Arthrobacter sp. TaxID=114050 RepID=A0A6J4IHN4_9MICC|nr:Gfo/Idh/MocA family oxidoreductase [uncultured Arthrobacter sp.]CAA9250731.1 MAG: Myo-inositol 2-dehydrogenase [uncultured Arthrobacter sp.]
MHKIRAALFGFGLGGRVFHAPFLAADPRFELKVIVTSDPGRATAARQAYPGAAVVSSAEEALARAADLDLAVISTPPATHAALAAAALEAPLHVVVDKPFVVDSAEGARLAELASSGSRVLTVFQNRRWDGDFLTVERLVREGALGRVRRFESRMEFFKPEVAKPWKKSAGPDQGGGILYDLGPHLIDQALRLFGPATLEHAELATARSGGGPDDDAFVVLRHEQGVLSHLAMNFLAPQAGPRFRITGSEASYTKWGVDPQEASIEAGMLPGDPLYGREPQELWGRLGHDPSAEPVETARGDYGGFYRQLAGAVRSGGAVPVEPEDSLAGLRLIEQAHRLAGG